MSESLDHPYLQDLAPLESSLIFVMGVHRSGTTLLYKTLAGSGRFNYLNAYHVIRYDQLLYNHFNQKQTQSYQDLAHHFKELGLENRIIDEVKVTPELPEEYGFILNNAGYPFYLNARSLSLFRELYQKIQTVSDLNKPLLLKNPWCFPHFAYIKQAIPNAKFIFIHRDPIYVLNSRLKAWQSFFSEWNPYLASLSRYYRQLMSNPITLNIARFLNSDWFEIGFRRMLNDSRQSTTYFLRHIDQIPEQDYVALRYEQFCQSPQEHLDQIFDFLGIQVPDSPEGRAQIQPRVSKLLPVIEKNQDRIREYLHPYYAFLDSHFG